jgi:predicted nucleic acid-binding protein
VTYLLDTNTCIGWLRQNQPQIVARIQAQSQTDIVLCSVVVGELRFGVERPTPFIGPILASALTSYDRCSSRCRSMMPLPNNTVGFVRT